MASTFSCIGWLPVMAILKWVVEVNLIITLRVLFESNGTNKQTGNKNVPKNVGFAIIFELNSFYSWFNCVFLWDVSIFCIKYILKQPSNIFLFLLSFWLNQTLSLISFKCFLCILFFFNLISNFSCNDVWSRNVNQLHSSCFNFTPAVLLFYKYFLLFC